MELEWATSTLGWILNLFVTAGLVVTGWYVRAMRDSVDQLKSRDRELARELSEVREVIAGNYVRRDAYDNFGREIFAKLDSMRLESKQDLKDAVNELKSEWRGELARKVDK